MLVGRGDVSTTRRGRTDRPHRVHRRRGRDHPRGV